MDPIDYSINAADMITPLQSGAALVADIQQTQVQPGQVAIWWLGQSGYAIKSASTLFYVDLYLSEHLSNKYKDTNKPHVRMTHAPLRGSDLPDVKYVFSSHKHSDHLDPGTLPDLFAQNPEAKLILPQANAEHTQSLGIAADGLITTSGDETLQVGPITVHFVPSAHPTFEHDDALGYPFVGFVFEVDGVTLYHSGDTLVYDGLADRLRLYEVDLAFLPINGTDARRTELHVPPNMNIEEALDLAKAIGQPLIVPHHYDMFTFNTVDVQQFIQAAEAASAPYRVMQCGEKFIFTAE